MNLLSNYFYTKYFVLLYYLDVFSTHSYIVHAYVSDHISRKKSDWIIYQFLRRLSQGSRGMDQ